ncbi:MAG: hypothetical protein WD894_09120 [Pirellulales bacterium]
MAKKQSRLTTQQREQTSEQGDIYLWTCVDQKTKLMPSFLIGKCSADSGPPRIVHQNSKRGPSVRPIVQTVGRFKKLANLKAAFAMFAAYYNHCWQTRHKG